MASTMVPMHDFPGLDLRQSPDGQGAIDLMNVMLDVPGEVGTRPGLAHHISTTWMPTRMAPARVGGGDWLFAISPSGIEALLGGSTQSDSGSCPSLVPHGTPTTAAVYFGGAGETVRKWASGFSSPAGMPRALHLAVAPWDNRLFAANAPVAPTTVPAAGATGTSTVWISDEAPTYVGNPEKWTASSFVHLTPGDGEEIRAAVSWRDYVFVFKESKFFVFFGTEPNVDGSPIFNYRTVNTGIGAFSHSVAVAAEDGVYFIGRDGVYRTNGGPPDKVSTALDPWFRGDAMPYWTGGSNPYPLASSPFNTPATISCAGESIYVRLLVAPDPEDEETPLSFITFVYQVPTRTWTAWGTVGEWGMSCFAPLAPASSGLVAVGAASPAGAGGIYLLDPSAPSDENFGDLASRYRTGFYDLGVQEEKRISALDLWGTGDLTVRVSRDFDGLDAGAAASLGADSAIDRARVTALKTKDGTVLSHQFGASSGRWRIHRCSAVVEGARLQGTDTP